MWQYALFVEANTNGLCEWWHGDYVKKDTSPIKITNIALMYTRSFKKGLKKAFFDFESGPIMVSHDCFGLCWCCCDVHPYQFGDQGSQIRCFASRSQLIYNQAYCAIMFLLKQQGLVSRSIIAHLRWLKHSLQLGLLHRSSNLWNLEARSQTNWNVQHPEISREHWTLCREFCLYSLHLWRM